MNYHTTLISVDLDDVSCYHAIYGLRPPSPEQKRIILERCLPRFLDLFAEFDVHATFFVVGRDLQRDRQVGGSGAAGLQRALAQGHELANHSHAHAYDLVRWSKSHIATDLHTCDHLLRDLGASPVGFRAPGYTHNATLLGEVAAIGYRYDSSALPSLPYYLAKLMAMTWIALRGGRSKSMARGWQSFVGPRRPHYLRHLDLWEVPMSVSPYTRLPLIGTVLLSGPEPLSGMLRRVAVQQPYFHLELHGIDLADLGSAHDRGDGFAPELMARLPELKAPLELRKERLRQLIRMRGKVTSIASIIES